MIAVMYEDIKSQLKILKDKKFSGHVRFGVMHGEVTSIFQGNYNFDVPKTRNEAENYNVQLLSLCDSDFFGSLEYDIADGEIVNFVWSRSWAGPALQAKLKEGRQCRCVRVVVKR